MSTWPLDELAARRRRQAGVPLGRWLEKCQEPGCGSVVELRRTKWGYLDTPPAGWFVQAGAARELVVKCPAHWGPTCCA